MDQTLPSLPPIPIVNKSSRKVGRLMLIFGIILIVVIAAGGLVLFLKMKPLQKQTEQQSQTDQSVPSSESSATVPSQPFILAVTIDEVSGNTLTVTASPPSVAQKKQYTVLIDSKTEILRSRIFDDSSKPVKETKLNTSSFKNGTQIVIYTNSDYNSSESLNAFKIEVLPKAP